MTRVDVACILIVSLLFSACTFTWKDRNKTATPATGEMAKEIGSDADATAPARADRPRPLVASEPGETDDALYTVADLNKRPRAILQSQPEMTEALRIKGKGKAVVAFVVDRNGLVMDPYVQSATDPVFEQPAIDTVSKWKFEPGLLDNDPVRVRMRVTVTFGETGRTTRPGELVRSDAKANRVPSWASELSGLELALWNDPDFKRRFAESYMAETDVEPSVTVAEREQMEEVLNYISSNQMADAADLLESYRNEAASAVFDFTLANIYFQQEQLDPAAAAYRIAVKKFPRFRRAWRNLGMIYVRKAEFEQAAEALTEVVALGGGDAATYGLLGFSYSNLGNSLSAESAYRMAIVLDPKTVDWKMGLARSLFKQQRFADAVALCGNLISLHPDQADLWLLQANAYIGLNQPLKAAENYEMVDHLNKSTAESLNNLADIYINQGLFEMAVNAYIRTMEMGGSNDKGERALRAAQVLIGRGALQESNRLIDSIELHYGSILLMEERKDLLKLKARIAVAEGSGEEEARVLEEVVELDPLDGEALILLGQYEGRRGDVEKAIFYYERASGLEAFEADAKVRQAQLLVNNGRYTEALPLLRRAQLLKPRSTIQEYLEQVERVAQSR